MVRHILLFSAFLTLVCGTAKNAYARRGIPIPIVCGHGEKLTELGDLPPEVSRGVAEEVGTPVTVAFLHHRAHVFWLDLWTWNGRHVLHSGDRYWEPDATGWQQLIGGDPSVKYGKPVLYRIPLLPALLVVVVIGSAVRSRFFKTEQEKLEALFNDERYQRAIQTLFAPGERDESAPTLFDTGDNDESAKVITTLDEQRFLRAKNALIGDGVDAHFAETNLRKMADAILANTNSQLDQAFAFASQLDQQGEWDQSADIYSQLISSLPQDDNRRTYARNCLISVNAKRAANATEQSGEPEPPMTHDSRS